MAYLSIVIPAYNEEDRIALTLEKIDNFFKDKNYDVEVIVVDDGSIDNTIEVANQSVLAKKGKLKIIKNGINKGKGFSIKNGITNSSGNYILFTDADLSTPIEEVDKLFNFINNGYDIVIGSRALKGSNVKVHQPWYREIMGKIFNFFIKVLLMGAFHDTQCGFKLFKTSIAKEITPSLRTSGFSFDVEMLYIARKKGYKIKEAPVTWLNSPKSKVNPLIDSTKMFFDLIKIKIIHG